MVIDVTPACSFVVVPLVVLPTVIVLALAPVPMFSAPVVPESTYSAAPAADCNSGVVKLVSVRPSPLNQNWLVL